MEKSWQIELPLRRLLTIVFASNIILALIFCTPLILPMVVCANYCDLSIVIMGNFIVQITLIMLARALQFDVPFTSANIKVADLLTWIFFAVLYVVFNNGYGIAGFPGSKWLILSNIYFFSMQLKGCCPYILYTIILLVIEYIICFFLQKHIDIKGRFIKKALTLTWLTVLASLFFCGITLVAELSPQGIGRTIDEVNIDVKVHRIDAENYRVEFSKSADSHQTRPTRILLKLDNRKSGFSFYLQDDAIYITPDIFSMKIENRGDIKIFENDSINSGESGPCMFVKVYTYPLHIAYHKSLYH